MAEQKANEQNQVQHENELTFADKVLEKIANYSVQGVEGILELQGGFTSGIKGFFSGSGEDETRGVSAEVGKKEVALDLEVIAEYGKDIPAAFESAIKKITENVDKMTGLKVVEVNMNVNDVVTRGEWERKQNEDQRKAAEERRRAHEDGEYSDGSRVQ
ncbi:Asp23/Gls24 family envelope stress response protein [Aerococcus sanguinicola]|uniref:Stress response regulator gls24 homolog n=1 Tax=Aerococcus sanguinicola TaxID=119206 RepID=A0A109RDF5_9LACT|nr:MULTISPECIES: Asp23/Gls24 family envelope stress response protein [Aerococcus]AMB94496.1 alkaline-shock protein [Aerococcus sanguinicola]MDK7049373.1 Asp23/Gls24 family envelope stress response protein [Aerococcus sanguinicola]OFT95642.1 alkaline-shock protein [Aerococcus sp. HMSC23C02]PKZ23509.1 Asp23/Gls24 family envelope stress response protein [Aerococcus sanguinicola]